MSHRILKLTVLAGLALTACRDAEAPTAIVGSPLLNQSEGRGTFQRYVAIGTSVSMGWASDGVVGASQLQSWPAQLARMAHREMSLPLISAPGCKAPFAAPLITFSRVSGESVTIPEASLICADNEPGVVLPAQNVAISGAWTGDALSTTPDLKVDAFGSKLYRRVLPLGETQVSAMEQQNPKFVSVELGANDILSILGGAVIPGVTIVQFATWVGQYDQILDRVGAVTKEAVLVGLAGDLANLPPLRRGSELWADRAAFLAAFNVSVNADCDGNQNLIVANVLVPTAVANGLVRKSQNLPPFVLSCTAGASTAQDRILTADEVAFVNAQGALMNNHIRAEATARGYAFFELGALYSLPKAPYSVVTQMTSGAPYGPNISFDGIHPSAAGSAILAAAAAQAIDTRYSLGLTSSLGIPALLHR
jgi:lysophospholipase L1-like esterase